MTSYKKTTISAPSARPAAQAPTGGQYQDANGNWVDSLGNPINAPATTFDNPTPTAGSGLVSTPDAQAFSTQTANASTDAQMRQQITYWQTHKATTLGEVQQKDAAYNYATDHGIKGAVYPDSDELALDPSFSTSYTAPLASVAKGAVTGAGLGGLVAGPAGALFGGFGGAVASGVVGTAEDASHNTAAFGANPTTDPSSYYAPGAGIQPTSAAGGAPGGGMSENDYLSQLAGVDQGQYMVDGMVDTSSAQAVGHQAQTNQTINDQLGTNLQNEQNLIGGYQGFLGGISQQYGDAASGANTQLGASAANFDSGTAADDAFLGANYGQYANTMAGFSQLSSNPYVGDIQENQGDINNENAALGNLNSIGSGSLNYTAQQAALTQAALSQAGSSAEDVGAEKGALGSLTGIGNGSLDVKNGSQSPEAYNAQLSALSQMGALTNPAATAQEKFLYEQQRQQEEQQEGAANAAVMENLRSRGATGGGLELTNMLGQNQAISQNRLLGDLGTQATAVQRATTDLQNYGSLASSMNSQGNQVAEQNQGTRLAGTTAQGQLASNIRGQSDAMSQFNTGQANDVATFNAGQANNTSQFNAGQANYASANNQQTMYNGASGAANLASSMRSQSDAIGTANQQAQMVTSLADQNFRATQQDDAVTRAGLLNDAGTTLGDSYMKNLTTQTGIDQGTTQLQLGNTNLALGKQTDLGKSAYDAGQQGITDTTGYWTGLGTRGQQDTNNTLGVNTGVKQTVDTYGQSMNDYLTKLAGGAAAQQGIGLAKS
jgi:hypothetical protein